KLQVRDSTPKTDPEICRFWRQIAAALAGVLPTPRCLAGGPPTPPLLLDRALFALCRPERLLELAFRSVVFDGGEKKIARYQQYFCAKTPLGRLRQREKRGARRGGVIWHTQGSGKSLTMVMLAKAIALEPDAGDYKIVLVTDRVDLDDQLYGTFRS